MHIADGIVTLPVLATGTTLAMAGVGLGMKRIDYEHMPQVAVISAAFFVASLIHVPIGPGQAHLILNGLAGLILGWAVFPALLIALLLQALFFGYGGITVLGVNTLNMALPGVVCYYLFRPLIRQNKSKGVLLAAGFATGALSLFVSALMIAGTLYLTNREFFEVAALIVMAHFPIMLVEGALCGSAIIFLKKTAPQLFL